MLVWEYYKIRNTKKSVGVEIRRMMIVDKVTINCPAKINLSLDVVGKRENGYHDLVMIMQSVALYDIIELEKNNGGINITCNKSNVPLGEENICYRAARKMIDSFNLQGGLDISINKNIPVAAGLAGGSTDAAGVIEGINELYGLKLSLKEMMELGLSLGADVPFCLHKGTALAEGIGEEITRLESVKAWCVLSKPNIEVSTKEVFGDFRLDEVIRHPDTEMLLLYIKEKNLDGLAQNMANVLETVTTKLHPKIIEIKNIMMEYEALGSIMSGSGPTVFGLFEDKQKAEKCYHRLKDFLPETYLVSTC